MLDMKKEGASACSHVWGIPIFEKTLVEHVDPEVEKAIGWMVRNFLLLLHFVCCPIDADSTLIPLHTLLFVFFQYEPYRSGREWWLLADFIRILLLTSCVGFMARTCYMKLLAALLILAPHHMTGSTPMCLI